MRRLAIIIAWITLVLSSCVPVPLSGRIETELKTPSSIISTEHAGDTVDLEHYTGEWTYDEQGICYMLEDGILDESGFDGPGWSIQTFTQKYDKQGKPLYTDIVIPDEINGIRVAGMWVGDLFQKHKEIHSIHFGKYMISIRNNAFEGCSGLKRIELPDSLLYLGDSAFKNCYQLEQVVLSDNLKKIDGSVFENCRKIKEILIPRTVKEIEVDAFRGCISLEKAVFQSAQTEVETEAFANTKWEKECIKKGIPLINNQGLLISTEGLSGDVVIDGKKKIGGKKVRRTAKSAFYLNKKIRTLTIRNVKEVRGLVISHAKKITVENVGTLRGDNKVWDAKTVVLSNIRKFAVASKISEWDIDEKKNHAGLLFMDSHKIQNLYIRNFRLAKGTIQYLKTEITKYNRGKSRKITIHVPKKDLARYRRLSRCTVQEWK